MTETLLKVGAVLFPTVSVGGMMQDAAWGGRQSISVRLRMSYDAAASLLPDGVAWSVVQRTEYPAQKLDENGTPVVGEDGAPVLEDVVHDEVQDCSEYTLSGAITDWRDGTVTVKMGKPTDLETVLAAVLMEE